MSDNLEIAKRAAIKLLASLPEHYPDAEMSIASMDDVDLWLGMGWLVGYGWAAYRGDGCFRFLTPMAREAAIQYLNH